MNPARRRRRPGRTQRTRAHRRQLRGGPARSRALSLFSATSSASLALGLIIGGTLTEWLSWRWVLFAGVPVGIAIVLLAPRFVRETEQRRGSFDLAGAVTGTAGVAALVYAFIHAPVGGWGDPLTLGAFGCAATLLAAFIVIEARAEAPIVPLRLLAERNRSGAYLNMLLVPAAIFDIIYFLGQYLQRVHGYGPLLAGAAFLPLTAAVFGAVRVVPALIRRVGTRPVMASGAVLVTAALTWLTRPEPSSGYASAVLGPLLLAGAGVGMAAVSLATTILSGVAAEDVGAASGVLQTMQWIGGGSLGLAVLVTAQGIATRGAEPGAPDTLVHGITSAFTVGAAATAVAVAISVLVVRAPIRQGGGRRRRGVRWLPRPRAAGSADTTRRPPARRR